jgi:hypothetical protein
VAQQLLGDPVARGAARAHEVLTAAHKVAQPFLGDRGRRHELQRAGAMQHQQPLGVAAVGLHPRARRDRHKRRRDDVARDPER